MATCECGRKWTGNSECHCATCHEHFTSDQAFIVHLASPQSDDACYPPAEAERKDGKSALVLTQRAHGPTWMVRDDRDHPFSNFGASPESPKSKAVA